MLQFTIVTIFVCVKRSEVPTALGRQWAVILDTGSIQTQKNGNRKIQDLSIGNQLRKTEKRKWQARVDCEGSSGRSKPGMLHLAVINHKDLIFHLAIGKGRTGCAWNDKLRSDWCKRFSARKATGGQPMDIWKCYRLQQKSMFFCCLQWSSTSMLADAYRKQT